MKSFEWNDHFVTGVNEVDEQHLYLVGFVNQYGKLLAENNVSTEDVRNALFELSRYAEYHFMEEEQLMRDANVVDEHLHEHIQVHRSFMVEIHSMQAFIVDGDHRPAALLLDFLIHWLAYHILGIDQKMARQIKAINSGVDPHEAYEKEIRERDTAIEPLLNALNGLFQQVSERNRELLKLNQSLEQKIEERTQQLYRANLQLEELSLTDSLTSLPNRRKAMKQLQAYWNEAFDKHVPLSCIMIDADYFKLINDNHGHEIGDRVLVELAQILKESFRTDDTVCRLGGDEFLVICPNTHREGALHIAQQVLSHVNSLLLPADSQLWAGSLSVGVAQKHSQMDDFSSLVSLADKALYKAKESGRNQVFCMTLNESMND